jgi:phosphatidylethanolamine-binding protein (PEBP) family uncharacterized protein
MRRGVGIVVLVVLAMLLASCGGSSPKAISSSPVTPGTRQPAGGPAVAYVAGTPISKASYEHWLAVERATGRAGNHSHRALAFLITSSWMLGEGSARHIAISQAEAQKRLRELERSSFPKPGQLQHYLAKSRQTTEDLLARVKIELLEHRIASDVVGSASGRSAREKIASFQQDFHRHWRRLTNCLPGYVMEDCKQYRGGPEAEPSSSRSSAPPRQISSVAAGARGEIHKAPGAFSISSPAFQTGGSIPSTYTCDGAGISPPLHWQKVPSGATELVLFVIDDSSPGSNGGIRWVVGGVSPSSNGVAAGKVPAGAVVGVNTAGTSAYSPICPAPGHTDTIEFVLYALKKRIALSPGFQPTVAEQEYGASNDVLGHLAITYAGYHRR